MCAVSFQISLTYSRKVSNRVGPNLWPRPASINAFHKMKFPKEKDLDNIWQPCLGQSSCRKSQTVGRTLLLSCEDPASWVDRMHGKTWEVSEGLSSGFLQLLDGFLRSMFSTEGKRDNATCLPLFAVQSAQAANMSKRLPWVTGHHGSFVRFSFNG